MLVDIWGKDSKKVVICFSHFIISNNKFIKMLVFAYQNR